MSKLNRFRWSSSILATVCVIAARVSAKHEMYVLEALCIVALFIDVFVITIKNRCPDCKHRLPLCPPFFRDEYCKSCGSKIE